MIKDVADSAHRVDSVGLPPVDLESVDLEPVDLPTEAGDVTVHLSCTQHMSQPPVKRTRKVLYTGFQQVAADTELAATNRARLGAVIGRAPTSVSQAPGHLG